MPLFQCPIITKLQWKVNETFPIGLKANWLIGCDGKSFSSIVLVNVVLVNAGQFLSPPQTILNQSQFIEACWPMLFPLVPVLLACVWCCSCIPTCCLCELCWSSWSPIQLSEVDVLMPHTIGAPLRPCIG